MLKPMTGPLEMSAQSLLTFARSHDQWQQGTTARAYVATLRCLVEVAKFLDASRSVGAVRLLKPDRAEMGDGNSHFFSHGVWWENESTVEDDVDFQDFGALVSKVSKHLSKLSQVNRHLCLEHLWPSDGVLEASRWQEALEQAAGPVLTSQWRARGLAQAWPEPSGGRAPKRM